jgi:hypothetical protein
VSGTSVVPPGALPGRSRMRRMIVALALMPLWVSLASGAPAPAHQPFTFAVACDMRKYAGSAYDSPHYFRGAMDAIDARGDSLFVVSPGDIDPVDGVFWTVTSTLGLDAFWYPVVGNHELPNAGDEAYVGANMDWLRNHDYDPNGLGASPDIVNTGPAGCPETTYSFDYDNSHFVVLNQYCDEGGDAVGDGDVPDHLYDWFSADLTATDREHIFVFGHEPAYPQRDADNERLRHLGDSLDQYPAHRDRFWDLLRAEGVTAYICGHTHNYSAVRIGGVWQLDAGHARGAGDTGAPSTFLLVHVDGAEVRFEAFRDEHDGVYDYDDIYHAGTLAPHRLFLPLISRTSAACP